MDTQTAQPKIELSLCPHWADYELLDSGDGEKLERFGQYIVIRPEPQAMWCHTLPNSNWQEAHAVFKGKVEGESGNWELKRPIDQQWIMHYQDLEFFARLTPFRHLGVFPEQASLWDWTSNLIKATNRAIKVLDLFAYTGLATLAAAKAGANVTYVDASKKSAAWAKENQTLSKLINLPIRWIVDDALKFARREVRRQAKYDGIILDPPKFGRGPKGEIWKMEELLPVLLRECRSLLTDRPLFVVLTAYATRTSALSLYYTLNEVLKGLKGQVSCGELAINERNDIRKLSTAIFTRWVAD